MIVMKFGGSSLESGEAVQRVVDIVKAARNDAPVVVVSAMGKTTDQLLRVGNLAAAGDLNAAYSALIEIAGFHLDQVSAGGSESVKSLMTSATAVVDRIAAGGMLDPIKWDALLSHGERLSSLLVTQALQNAGVDAVHLCAEKLIVTDACHTKASPLVWETYARIRRAVPTEKSGKVAVMGGFIGATESGTPTTLGRGGSDYTAALAGAALNAEEVQIWTDVNGMLSCDPRVTPGGRCLRQISYAEATEMAEWGAKVLHPATVAPAMRQRIPVSIRNSRNPGHPGTHIEGVSTGRYEGVVKSIACLRGVTLLRIFPPARTLTAQFRSLIQAVCQKHRTDFRVFNSKNVVEIAVREAGSREGLVEELSALGRVETETGLSAITLIGKGLDANFGLVSYATRILCKSSVAFHALGSSALRVTFLVADQELVAATKALHNELVMFQENGPFYREFEVVRKRREHSAPAAFQTPAYS